MAIRAGVIGVGHLGQHHARIYSGMEGVSLDAVVDADIERAREIAGKYGSKAYSDWKEAIDGLDAISIAVPTSLHYPIALECLRRGKDLLVEKPITVTVREADELIEEAEKRGLILQIGHLERYNPAVVAAYGLVREPMFFEAERVSPFLGRATDVDATIDLMIHDIDIISGMLGGAKVVGVKASGLSLVTDRIDFAEAWLEFQGGPSAVIKASRIADETSRELRVYQKDSVIAVNYKDRKVKRSLGSNGLTEEHIEVADAEPLKEELKDFMECVRTRRRPMVSGIEGRDALETANRITEEINGKSGYIRCQGE